MAERLEWREKPSSGPLKGCLVVLHGRGTTGEDLMPLAEEIGLPGLRWIFPDAPFPFPDEFGGRMWYGSPPERQTGIVQSRRMLFDLLNRLIKQEGISSDRIVLAGFSQGAVISLDVGLRFPERLAGLIAMSGYLAAPETLSAEKSSAGKGMPILLLHGTIDEVVPAEGSRAALPILLKEGFQARLQEYPIGHQVIPEEIDFIRAFLKNLLSLTA